MTDFTLTDLKTKLLLLSQEQIAQTEQVEALWSELRASRAQVEYFGRRLATMEAAHQAHVTVDGKDATVTFPPEWGGVPLVEVE
jgi:hypothetical protein